MNRNIFIVLALEVLYKGYFDRTGELPSRVDFIHDLRKALPYVRLDGAGAIARAS